MTRGRVASLIAQGFRRVNLGGGTRGIKRGNEGDEQGYEGDEDAVGEARRKGYVVDGIDLGGEREEVEVSEDEADGIADDETEDGADDSDEQALEHEDAADLGGLGAHGDEHGDVLGLLHHHHDERDEDVEGGDEDDQADSNKGYDPFQAEGVE